MTSDPRYEHLVMSFLKGLDVALAELRSMTAGKDVYAIAINPGDLYDEAFLYANTIDSLPDNADAAARLSAKWCIADWRYQAFGEAALRALNDEIADMIGDVYELDSEELHRHCQRMKDVYAGALTSDAFLDLLARHFKNRRPVLAVFQTDQSDEEMVSSVEQLNPRGVATAFKEELRSLRRLQQFALSSRRS